RAKLKSPRIERSWNTMIASTADRYGASCDSSVARAMTRSAMSSSTADSTEVSSRKSAISTEKRSGIEDSFGHDAGPGRDDVAVPRRGEPGQDRVGIGHGERGVIPGPIGETQPVGPVADRQEPGEGRRLGLDPHELLAGHRPRLRAPARRQE